MLGAAVGAGFLTVYLRSSRQGSLYDIENHETQNYKSERTHTKKKKQEIAYNCSGVVSARSAIDCVSELFLFSVIFSFWSAALTGVLDITPDTPTLGKWVRGYVGTAGVVYFFKVGVSFVLSYLFATKISLYWNKSQLLCFPNIYYLIDDACARRTIFCCHTDAGFVRSIIITKSPRRGIEDTAHKAAWRRMC